MRRLVRESLDIVERRALVTTSTNALLEAEETPLDLRRDQMSLVYWIQFRGFWEKIPGKWMVNEHWKKRSMKKHRNSSKYLE